MLELRELIKRYAAPGAEEVRAIDGVSLSLEPRELVALYGPSGSGKSTLLLLIAALVRPDSGAILFEGNDVTGLSPRAAARYRMRDIGIVRQTVELVPGLSAIDNAALKLLGSHMRTGEARKRVEPLLRRLGLGDRLSHRAHELSVGERQRVMIARALSTNPRLVLADEPTGSLDTRRGREVLALLGETCHDHGAGMLLVTHDPQAAQVADRVHTLRDGRLLAFEPDRGLVSPLNPS